MPPHRHLVFAYGSLLRRGPGVDLESAIACRLHGFRRAWNVAMDNALTVPGYKHYVDPRTGERPPVHVTFLNLRPHAGEHVNGVVYPVDHADLPALDRRERNYERHDVTGLLGRDLGARVWAYLGRHDARRRFEAARRDGRAVVSRPYRDGVRAGFADVDPAMLAEFDRTTDAPGVPVRALRRVDVPRGR
jgi:hypothetical protein